MIFSKVFFSIRWKGAVFDGIRRKGYCRFDGIDGMVPLVLGIGVYQNMSRISFHFARRKSQTDLLILVSRGSGMRLLKSTPLWSAILSVMEYFPSKITKT